MAHAVSVQARGLTLAHGERVLQRNLDFDVRQGEVLAITGASGCGKSTLLRHLVGLQAPAAGQVLHDGVDLQVADGPTLSRLRRRMGVSFQSGALWSSLSVGENLMLPLELLSDLDAAQRQARARSLLERVGLADSFDREPAALSGGMRKRAAIARSLVLQPAVLFLDEPSAGLDPVASAQLDALIDSLRRELDTAVVMVTHELASLFALADRMLFLDVQAGTMTALGAPAVLMHEGPGPVREFLGRQGRTPVRSSPASPLQPDSLTWRAEVVRP